MGSALPGESLGDDAARLVPLVDPGRPWIVGGASFGGVVALELAAGLPLPGAGTALVFRPT